MCKLLGQEYVIHMYEWFFFFFLVNHMYEWLILTIAGRIEWRRNVLTPRPTSSNYYWFAQNGRFLLSRHIICWYWRYIIISIYMRVSANTDIIHAILGCSSHCHWLLLLSALLIFTVLLDFFSFGRYLYFHFLSEFCLSCSKLELDCGYQLWTLAGDSFL